MVHSDGMRDLIRREKIRRDTEDRAAFGMKVISNPLTVSFTDLNLILKKGRKVVLRNVFGSIRSFNITALMGPSGAGKNQQRRSIYGNSVTCRENNTAEPT